MRAECALPGAPAGVSGVPGFPAGSASASRQPLRFLSWRNTHDHLPGCPGRKRRASPRARATCRRNPYTKCETSGQRLPVLLSTAIHSPFLLAHPALVPLSTGVRRYSCDLGAGEAHLRPLSGSTAARKHSRCSGRCCRERWRCERPPKVVFPSSVAGSA